AQRRRKAAFLAFSRAHGRAPLRRTDMARVSAIRGQRGFGGVVRVRCEVFAAVEAAGDFGGLERGAAGGGEGGEGVGGCGGGGGGGGGVVGGELGEEGGAGFEHLVGVELAVFAEEEMTEGGDDGGGVVAE